MMLRVVLRCLLFVVATAMILFIMAVAVVQASEWMVNRDSIAGEE